MATVSKAWEETVRRKKGYVLPSLRASLMDAGEIVGTCEPPDTRAAAEDASEQPAPTIALTPAPLNASWIRCNAPIRPC
eukprot:1862951-Prymnesium_polylepis.2